MPRASQLDPAVARRLPPVSYELVIGVSALLGLLGLMYGGVGARGQVVLWGGAALLALVTAGRWVLGKGAAWSWVMLLPLGFVGLVALQGFGLLGFESGDPHATRVEMGRLLAVTALFGVMLPLSSRSRRRVLLGMAGAGALAVGVALLQMLMGEHSILGVWPLPQRSSYSGPFVHYGHFAQFVNLSIGAALGFLLWRVRARRPGQELRARDLLGHAGERGAVEGWLWAFVLVAMVTIAVSMSRNGVVSMLVAGAVTTALLQRGRVARGLGWPIAALALLAVGVLMVVGFDPVYERMSTLGEIGAAYEGRGALLMDTLSGWLERPVLGHGQGAFEVAFPMYDSSMRGGTAAHAENQYAELLFEGGVLGFGLIAGFGLLVLRAWRQALRGEGSDVYVYGLGFGLIAVAFHAGTDFGLRIPAVAAMTMVAAGLIVGATARPVRGMVGRVAGAGLWLGMALLLGLQLPGAIDRIGAEDAARRGEELRARVLADGAGRGTAAEYRELLSLYETAVRLEPGEIEHAYWAAVYRWQGRLAELMEAGAGTGTGTGQGADRPAAAATLTVDELERLRADPEVLAAAERAIAELRAASELAPSWGLLWSTLGQIGVRWLGDPGYGDSILRGRLMAPQNPAVCFAAADEYLRRGEDELAVQDYQRAVLMGMDWRRVIGSVLIEQLRPEIALQVAAEDPRRLFWIAERLEEAQLGDADVLETIRARGREILAGDVGQGIPEPWKLELLARELARAEDWEAAAACYAKYLMREPYSPARRAYAAALVQLGRKEEAEQEYRRHLRAHDGDTRARRELKALIMGSLGEGR